ncbi:MAG: hypothetical protein H6822_04035 [Planctomycetaceae bacterium]|nr:hypothetical protein [Planctomycetales bacterium]MCB9921327.1 hypothetical protein [Planctomycetaceae bacterium]
MPRLPSVRRQSFAVILITGILLVAGCHRGYYRTQADADAYAIVNEKAQNPHWALPRQTIEIDPRSRMFDPFDRDRPPMPTDDPTAHQLMHYVDHKRGYPHWHANGDVDTAENPDWMAHLPVDENGVLNLTADQAYQLALIHSRDYQQQFETLYLSALDVSAERFRFDTQFFGGYQSTGAITGSGNDLTASTYSTQTGRSGLPAGGVAVGTLGSAGGRGSNQLLARRSFSTGADLAVGLANSLVWTFDGSNTFTPTTLLNVGFIQPLLRRAGRDRIMEQLTLSERTVLSNVRQMERYRSAFYVSTMTGRDPGNGASRRGGVFGSGLEGFTGVGGGFGGVGGGGGGGGNSGITGGTGAAAAGGYYGLLQTQQDIRNQKVTIAGLRSNLAQLRESLRENLTKIPDDPETILRERLQIAQARQALLNAESRLLNSLASYQSTLDNFKRTLGLPPQLCVNIQDDIFSQFNLISPETINSQAEVAELRADIGLVNEQILELLRAGGVDTEPTQAVWSDELAERLRMQRAMIDRIRNIYQNVAATTVTQTRKDIERLVQSLDDRKQDLLTIKTKYTDEFVNFELYGGLDPCQVSLLTKIDASVYDVEALDAVPAKLNEDVERLEAQFNSYDEPLAEIQSVIEGLLNAEIKPSGAELAELLEQRVIFATPSLLSELSEDILDVSLVQARARTHTVRVEPIDLKWDMAVELARRYRRDWMNARTSLVDAWRLIEFNADNLEGILDLEVNGTLRSDNSDQLQMALRFDAPITRLTERNTYRQSLIEYQQAKRSYYAYVDGVTQSLRNTLRTIDLNRVNFEERRVAVLSAIDQVVLNDQIQKLREERGQEAGVTAARDVVSALADLQTAQTDFLNVWVNYEVQRLNLDLDLGTMNLDSEGNWIDPGPIGGPYGYPAPIGFEESEAGYIFELHAEEPELLPNPLTSPDSELPVPMSEGNEARSSRRTFRPVPQPQPPADLQFPIVPASYDVSPAAMRRLPSIH